LLLLQENNEISNISSKASQTIKKTQDASFPSKLNSWSRFAKSLRPKWLDSAPHSTIFIEDYCQQNAFNNEKRRCKNEFMA